MSIIPPFDQLTKIPAFGVDKIQQQFNVVTDFSLNQIKEVIKDIKKAIAYHNTGTELRKS